MNTCSCICFAVCLSMLLILPAAHFALAERPDVERAAHTRSVRTIPAVPSQASRAHNIMLRVMKVTPIEQIDETQILKLDVERHYGKIDTISLHRAQEHETRQFSVLFPASLDADVRPGDLINYSLVGYTAIGRE